MISVASYVNPVEAEMACEFLKSNGITAAIADSTGLNVLSAANPLTNLGLIVETAQVAEARKLLAGYVGQSEGGDLSTGVVPVKRFDGYYEAAWNERERAAESAYRAAVIGWFVPLVSWYAAWQLLRVFVLSLPLNACCARRAWIAAALMVVPAGAYFAIATMIILS